MKAGSGFDEERGWVDTLYLHGRPDAWVTAPRPYSVLREDYVLASAPMSRRLERSWVSPRNDRLSDHVPVLATFV